MIKELPNYEGILKRSLSFPQETRWKIDFAYQISKAAHRGQTRESGERYLDHPKSVFLIITDIFKLKNPDLMIASLIHDCGEDTPIFGNPTKISYRLWVDQAKYLITEAFGDQVAEIFLSVTRPKVDNVEFFTKEDTEKFAKENLKTSTLGIILKIADRMHNFETMADMPKDKILAKIKETREDYYPIFELARKDYPEIVEIGIQSIEASIKKLEVNLPKS